MKKCFFYAAVASVALASCTKGNDVVAPEEQAEKQAIQFVMNNAVEITTRGTGAVGDIEGGSNEWAGEELRVFMFEKGTMNLATDPNSNYAYFFNNEAVYAPNGGNEGAASYVTETKYYPGHGNYDFFAYHADDAIAEGIKQNTDAFTVKIKIDGTQDIMTAKAGLSESDKANYLANADDDDFSRVYSAYSARRNVHPRFQFSHELSRLVFNVVGEEDGVATYKNGKYTGIQIDSVKLINTKTTGTMTVAATDTKALGIAWNDVTGSLKLEGRNTAGQETTVMAPFQFIEGYELHTPVRIGESMLIAPGQGVADSLVFYYTQRPNGDDSKIIKNEYKYELENNFEKGKQYNVQFKVYNNQEIKLSIGLTAWEEDNNDILVDSEEE